MRTEDVDRLVAWTVAISAEYLRRTESTARGQLRSALGAAIALWPTEEITDPRDAEVRITEVKNCLRRWPFTTKAAKAQAEELLRILDLSWGVCYSAAEGRLGPANHRATELGRALHAKADGDEFDAASLLMGAGEGSVYALSAIDSARDSASAESDGS